MKRFLRLGLVWLFVGVSLTMAEGIQFGMSPDQVKQELGRPRSTMVGANREVWIYEGGGRVEFVAGRATSITDLPITELLTKDTAIPGSATGATAGSDGELGEMIDESADAQEMVGGFPSFDDIEDFDSLGEGEEELSPTHELVALGLELLIGFLVMIPVLKGAFAWSDIHGDWSQMILPALAAVVSGTVVRAVAYYGMGTDQLFHVDHVISYATLLFVLMKTTHASTMKRAVTVAGVAKVASIVVWSLLSVFLLQLAFA